MVKKLRDADAVLAFGKTVGQGGLVLEVSEQTFHRWRNEYGARNAGSINLAESSACFCWCDVRAEGVRRQW